MNSSGGGKAGISFNVISNFKTISSNGKYLTTNFFKYYYIGKC